MLIRWSSWNASAGWGMSVGVSEIPDEIPEHKRKECKNV
jgi:hypothetical protein